ncbi:InlB B-repeat-containing protein [Candidatus Izemoplasma sp. B36]|uniref:InlB B-repeat-containing protein n=1 Tax=Candidatus Izemoplasma sp. B36 TaxID=3242468 RepID=UPI00355909F9
MKRMIAFLFVFFVTATNINSCDFFGSPTFQSSTETETTVIEDTTVETTLSSTTIDITSSLITSENPTTEASTTEASTTEAPTTETPTTETPTTILQTTTVPTTTVPVTTTQAEQEYNIIYYLDGGTNSDNNPNTYTESGATIIFDAPTKEGYVFMGWYYSGYYMVEITEIVSGSTGDYDIYAKWANDYDVSYVFFESEYGPDYGYKIVYNDTPLEVPEVSNYNNYVFLGWYLDESFTTPWYPEFEVTQDLTVYAKWDIANDTYKITYNIVDEPTNKIEFILEESDYIVDVFTGYQRAIVTTHLGHVYSFGRNEYGEVGAGSTAYALVDPVDIASALEIDSTEGIQVYMGTYHTILMLGNGTVYGWGSNNYGQLGLPTSASVLSPVCLNTYLGLDPGEGILDIAVTASHTLILTSYHRIMSYGYNNYFLINDEEDMFVAQDISYQFILNPGENIIDLTSNLFITDQGRILMYGEDYYWATGDTDFENVNYLINIANELNISMNESINSIQESNGQILFLTSEGRILVLGRNLLGLDDSYYDGSWGLEIIPETTPVDISNWFNGGIEDIKLGYDFGVVLMTDGSIYTWGVDEPLGDYRIEYSFEPYNIDHMIQLLEGDKIISIEVTDAAIFALSEYGNLYAWGDNVNGQLGTFNYGGSYPFTLYAEVPFITTVYQEVSYLEYATINPLVLPEKNWFEFDGWYLDEARTIPFTKETMPKENVILYGSYEYATYDINYVLDGGTNNSLNGSYYSYYSWSLEFFAPEKEGYTFAGWYDNPDFIGEPITILEYDYYGEITLYAKWIQD